MKNQNPVLALAIGLALLLIGSSAFADQTHSFGGIRDRNAPSGCREHGGRCDHDERDRDRDSGGWRAEDRRGRHNYGRDDYRSGDYRSGPVGRPDRDGRWGRDSRPGRDDRFGNDHYREGRYGRDDHWRSDGRLGRDDSRGRDDDRYDRGGPRRFAHGTFGYYGNRDGYRCRPGFVFRPIERRITFGFSFNFDDYCRRFPHSYEPLGSTELTNFEDFDVISVNKRGIREVLFRVSGEDAEIDHLVVEFYNGDTDEIERHEFYQAGTSSGWIDLKGGTRQIKKIVVVGRTVRGYPRTRNRARIELFGRS